MCQSNTKTTKGNPLAYNLPIGAAESVFAHGAKEGCRPKKELAATSASRLNQQSSRRKTKIRAGGESKPRNASEPKRPRSACSVAGRKRLAAVAAQHTPSVGAVVIGRCCAPPCRTRQRARRRVAAGGGAGTHASSIRSRIFRCFFTRFRSVESAAVSAAACTEQ